VTKHYNPSIVENANRILASKAGDYLSDEVQGPVAVIPILPITNIIKTANSSTTGSVTLYTTPTDKDFYLTSLQISLIKDATNDNATGTIGFSITVDGVVIVPLGLAVLTLTAQNSNAVLPLSISIKVNR